ncbi:MAG: hypothetical protein ACOCQD_00425 [archaeon]
MSYDIRLKDPNTGETITTDEKHDIRGGTYAIGGTNELTLNITYNYSTLIYRVMDNDKGIRTIYGMTGEESIPIIDEAIRRLKEEESLSALLKQVNLYATNNVYQSSHEKALHQLLDRMVEILKIVEDDLSENYWNPTIENVIIALENVKKLAEMAPHGIWDGD